MQAIASFGKRLQCPICLNVCTQPVTLPCSHFFCRQCILSYKDANNAAHHASTLQFKQPKRKAGEFDCPVCRLPCNHRQTGRDDTLDAVTGLFRQLRQLVEDESGMQLSQDVPLHTHSIPPPNNSPPRPAHAAANGTATRRRQRSRSPAPVLSTGRRAARTRPTRRTAAPSLDEDEEDDAAEEEEEAEEEDPVVEMDDERMEEHKEERRAINGTSGLSESSQKENVDPMHDDDNNTARGGTGKSRKRRQTVDSAEADGADDEMPLLEDVGPADRANPSGPSHSKPSRPRDHTSVAGQAPDLFASRKQPTTPYARAARNGHTAPAASTPTKTSLASLPSSKPHLAPSAARHPQPVASLSVRRKQTVCTLLTSHLDDDQLALLKELEAMMNLACAAEGRASAQHPRVVVTSAWSPAVTHLVTSASTATASLVTRRTNKYFLAMLSPHVHIVTIDWVTECIVARRLLDAAQFRVKGDTRHATGGEARRKWIVQSEAEGGVTERQLLFAGWRVSDAGKWSNAVVRNDVRSIVEVGGGQWLGGDEDGGGGAAVGKRYVLYDDGKKVAEDNRALLSDEMVRSYEVRGISVAPCSWLFDCVSSFSILPVPTSKQQTSAG